MKRHPSDDVNRALTLLNDALCSWERSTGWESVLILMDQDGFVHRSVSGKPLTLDGISDTQCISIVIGGQEVGK
jgi:hypothetical protein